jgi:hypothetical protein
MSLFDETRSVERPRFFDGQALFASDLDGIVAFHRAMRWLHNRSLHQVGIGNGLAVSGLRGDREVRVQPGYALDAHGREIVLLDVQVEQVPPVASERDGGPVWFDLTVAYPDDEDLEEAETREGICRPRGAVRLRERPVFCWVRLIRDISDRFVPLSPRDALDIQSGLKIVLARAAVKDCRLHEDLSIAERRNARPPLVPRIACGRADAEWDPWTIDDPGGNGDQLPIGLRAPVDTREPELRVTPCYSVRVAGPRPLLIEIEDGDGDGEPVPLLVGATSTFPVIDVPAFVQDATATGFECFVALFGLEGREDAIDAVVAAARKSWGVEWLAVED